MIRLLDSQNTGLLIIDVQEKLIPAINQKERIIDNIKKLIRLSELFNLPVILTEQNPDKIGSTLSEVKESLPAYEPISKLHFNCCEVDAFKESIESKKLENLIISGVETHICVFQTAMALLKNGYHVQVPQDAVGSRTDENWQVGLHLMRDAGAIVTSTETIIYQILKQAGTDEFRKMLKVIK
ncbi:MAG: hydrolase [Deltaproteobacteria bacterium]|nr:hydrolase [Deltaproteobacteria bacterium]